MRSKTWKQLRANGVNMCASRRWRLKCSFQLAREIKRRLGWSEVPLPLTEVRTLPLATREVWRISLSSFSAEGVWEMKYRKLGNTGLIVSSVALGTMQFGGKMNMGNLDQEDTTRMVKLALDRGINFIDTADVYSSRGERDS